MKAVVCFVLLLASVSCLAQNSKELEAKRGYREIKLWNSIETIRSTKRKDIQGGAIYKYKGESNTLYRILTDSILVYADHRKAITRINIYLDKLNDERFFGLLKAAKEDLGESCFMDMDAKTICWKTDRIVLMLTWDYKPLGEWKPMVIISRIEDLPQYMRKVILNEKDGF